MWLKSLQTSGQKLAADAAVALILALVVGFVLASLSAAGIITMTLAIVLLVVAWVVAMTGTFVMTNVWNPSHKHRVLFGLLFAGLLTVIGFLEYRAQPAQAQSLPTSPAKDNLTAQPPASYKQDCSPGAACSQGQTGGQVIGTMNQFGPSHQPNGIYQNGQYLGSAAASSLDEGTHTLTLTSPHISGGAIDFSAPLEFRDTKLHDYLIQCSQLHPSNRGSASVTINVMGNTICTVIR